MSAQIQAHQQENDSKIHRLWPNIEHKMSQRRPELSHHLQWPHVLLSRSPEQREAHTRRRQAGVGARGSACPLFYEGKNQEVSGQGQSRSEQGAHTDAWHGSVLHNHKRLANQGEEDKSLRVTDVLLGEKGIGQNRTQHPPPCQRRESSSPW